MPWFGFSSVARGPRTGIGFARGSAFDVARVAALAGVCVSLASGCGDSGVATAVPGDTVAITTSTGAALTPTPPTTTTTAAPTTVPPTTIAPAPPTTIAPAPPTTLAPAPPTTLAPAPPTTLAPAPPTTLAPAPPTTFEIAGTLDLTQPQLLLGRSVEGRPIIADRYGTPGGRRVLVIGVIHGNEDAGVQIVDALRSQSIPDGIEVWLVEAMNPDGYVAQVRQNANQVDLNRNFPYQWGPIGVPGDSQYAGTGPASEPETQAMVNFIGQLRPDIAIWYHQDANLVIPSTGRDGRIRARYAELTGLPIATCCDGGGVYTGIAATWARQELKRTSDAVPFIVELPGGELDDTQIAAHANAVLAVAAEG